MNNGWEDISLLREVEYYEQYCYRFHPDELCTVQKAASRYLLRGGVCKHEYHD